METLNVSFQLFHSRRAKQGTGNKRLTAHEGQRHLRRIQAVALRDIHIGCNGFLRLLAAVAGKAAKEGITRPGRFRTVQLFPRQGAETEA